jgi:hypothetical protein
MEAKMYRRRMTPLESMCVAITRIRALTTTVDVATRRLWSCELALAQTHSTVALDEVMHVLNPREVMGRTEHKHAVDVDSKRAR